METFRVPYHKDYIEFSLPQNMKGHLLEPPSFEPLGDFNSSLIMALSSPVNSPPLKEIAKGKKSVSIVFTDITRASPDHLIVPAILQELRMAGIKKEQITLICGVGMHRPSTQEEKIQKLGRDVAQNYRVIDHDPKDRDCLLELGYTDDGGKISINRIACESELLIATGIVEPHLYAGYSGGRKTVAIGAGGEEFISYTHGPKMVGHPGTRLGKIEGNPFHHAITTASKRAGLNFIVNVIQDENKHPLEVMAGEPEETFKLLVGKARKIFEVEIPRQFDIAIGGVGYPKDMNLYQTSRSATYLFFAPTPVVRPGGVIIIPAKTPEGVGDGVGEKNFLKIMQSAKDMGELISELTKKGYPPGAQRAFVMAKVLEKNTVIIVGSETPKLVEALHMIPAKDMDQALAMAGNIVGKRDIDVLIVPYSLLSLPVVKSS